MVLQVHSTFSFAADSDFLNNDIRVKPDLDSLGALGDAGWYCTRSILWAADYELPKTVVAHPKPVTNDAGVILSCGSSLIWEDGRVATFHCSFVAHYPPAHLANPAAPFPYASIDLSVLNERNDPDFHPKIANHCGSKLI